MSGPKLSAAAMMDAAAHCNLKRVRELLAAGAGAKHLATKSQNAITEACFGWWGGWEKKEAVRLAVVRELADAACPVEGAALFRPIGQGELELVQFLIDRGADVNVVAAKEFYTFVPKSCTPLGVAIRSGHVDVVAALIKGGANVRQRTGRTIKFGSKWEWSPIVEAARCDRAEIIGLLAAAGADLDVIDPDNELGTALLTAISLGNEAAVKALIDLGADVNLTAGSARWLPLALAKELKKAKIVKLLEKASAGVAKPFATKEQLGKAAERGDLASVRKLIASGADIHAPCSFAGGEKTPLALAAANSHDKVVSALLKAGAKVEAADVLNATPLFHAAENGHAKVVRLLLAAGADADVKVKAAYDGKVTPLIAAAERGQLEVVQALVKHGADVRFRTLTGKTALVAAATAGHTRVVRVLIAAVKSTRQAGRAFDAPLWWAVYNGHVPTVKLLLAAGANPGVKATCEGESVSAVDIARKQRTGVLRLLRDAAKPSIAKRARA
jgi:ankyrin repeat protein